MLTPKLESFETGAIEIPGQTAVYRVSFDASSFCNESESVAHSVCLGERDSALQAEGVMRRLGERDAKGYCLILTICLGERYLIIAHVSLTRYKQHLPNESIAEKRVKVDLYNLIKGNRGGLIQ